MLNLNLETDFSYVLYGIADVDAFMGSLNV